jgi:hypothetical protein
MEEIINIYNFSHYLFSYKLPYYILVDDLYINLLSHRLDAYVFYDETYCCNIQIYMFYRRGVWSLNPETSGLRASCIGFEVPIVFTTKSVFLRIV